MSLVLLNLKSNQQIKLEDDTPLVIGRENVIGCSDKRISRNHLKVTCKDGQINLKSLHTNPCFFTRNGVPPVHKLEKNEEVTLKERDCIGLLPDSWWFVVTSSETVKIKLEKEDSESDCAPNQTEGCSVSPRPGTSNCVPDSNPETPSKNTSKGVNSSEFQKTRRLPLWMYETNDPKEVKKSPNKRAFSDVADKTRKKPKASKEKKDTGNTPEVCEIKVEPIDLDLPSTSVFGQGDASKTTSTSCDSVLKQNSSGEQCNDSNKKGPPTDTTDQRRPICQYEGDCYRENPNHKQSFTHPGDPDFVPYEDRPMCKYGAACYRKNQAHKVEYRHPPADESAPSSPSSQCSSVVEERPPCIYGSSCSRKSPQHRKDLYHPPKGYKCYYGRSHPSADRDSPDDLSIASSYEYGTDPRPSFARSDYSGSHYSDLDAAIFSSDEDWMYVGCDEDYYWF